MKALAILLFAVLFLRPSLADAHEIGAAEIDVEILSPIRARVAVRGAVTLEAPLGCRWNPAPTPSGVLECPHGLAGQLLEVDGADVAFVSMHNPEASAVVTRRVRSFTLPGTAAATDVVTRYLRLGIEHVLSGADHVLFLIALFFQAWSTRRVWRELLRTATAFTLAHSVTLGATMLGLLHIRADVAEACIAWSLVLVALDMGRRTSVPLAAAFGLVHGLGFAGALAETRLPDAARWTALLAFNLGIEGGQLFLFAACVLVVRVLPRRAPTMAAYAVGVSGAAMFFLRAISIFR